MKEEARLAGGLLTLKKGPTRTDSLLKTRLWGPLVNSKKE